MNGILYAVGVGPGDPELITVKALKVLEEADVVACPAKGGEPGIAYRIAEQAYPGIALKERLVLDLPMKNGDLSSAHREAAEKICAQLRAGKNRR